MKDFLVFGSALYRSPFLEDAMAIAAEQKKSFRACVVGNPHQPQAIRDIMPADALSVGAFFGTPKEAFEKVKGFDAIYTTEKWRHLDIAVRLERAGFPFITARAAYIVQPTDEEPISSPEDERHFNRLLRDHGRITPVEPAPTTADLAPAVAAEAASPVVDTPRNGVVRSPADDEPTAKHEIPPDVAAAANPRVRTPSRPKMKK